MVGRTREGKDRGREKGREGEGGEGRQTREKDSGNEIQMDEGGREGNGGREGREIREGGWSKVPHVLKCKMLLRGLCKVGNGTEDGSVQISILRESGKDRKRKKTNDREKREENKKRVSGS